MAHHPIVTFDTPFLNPYFAWLGVKEDTIGLQLIYKSTQEEDKLRMYCIDRAGVPESHYAHAFHCLYD